MKNVSILVCLLAAFVLGCTGSAPGVSALAPGSIAEASLIPLHGTSTKGIEVRSQPDEIILKFTSIPADGQLFRVPLAAPLVPSAERWQGDAHLLHLVEPVAEGMDVGVYPTRLFAGGPVTARITLSRGLRTASYAPRGEQNAVTDLTVIDQGEGQVLLEWTQVNAGDYNVNGLVEISDLTPLGQHYLQHAGAPGWEVARVADGNGDGLISISDITQIGQNWQAYVAGYLVRRNEVAVHFIGMEEAENRMPLPARYSLVLEGLTSDTWTVSPLDAPEGNEGPPSITPFVTELEAHLAISGLALLDLLRTGTAPLDPDTTPLDPNYAIMRIIFPGDVPGIPLSLSWRTIAGDTVHFAGVPREQPLFLRTAYAPIYDLASGDLRQVSGLRGASAVPEEERVFTAVPFRMREENALFSIDTAITLTENLAGGYFVDQTAGVDDGSAATVVATRLDYKNALVAADTDANADFEDEAWLTDSDLDNVSDARLEELLNNEQYQRGATVTVTGLLASFAESQGAIELADAWELGEAGHTALGSVTVRFSELTTFGERMLGAPDEPLLDLDPSLLTPGMRLQLRAYPLYADGGGPLIERWAESVELRSIDMPPDTIRALPDSFAVEEGETVTITVYCNQTTNPFQLLSACAIVVEQGNFYVADSLNAGAPGGARDSIDGLWAQMHASALILPDEATIVETDIGGGDVRVDFAVVPVDGADLADASGALFSFQLECHTAEVNVRLLREDATESRTYYSDGSANPYFWNSDDNAGVPPITVSPPEEIKPPD